MEVAERRRQPRPPRLPHEAALRRALIWKRLLSYAAVAGLGGFLWLTAHHVVGVTATARSTSATPPPTTSPASSGSGQASSSQEGFFNGAQGYGFGSSTQPALSTTGAS